MRYCVTEGTLNTSDGAWAVSFDELYEHHDEVEISEGNGIDELVLKELQMRDEVSEAIQTEDGYEITYHLEHCPQCHAGGTFYKSDLFNCRIANSCYEGTRFVGTSTKDQYIDTDSTMTNEEWTHPTEGQVMQ